MRTCGEPTVLADGASCSWALLLYTWGTREISRHADGGGAAIPGRLPRVPRGKPRYLITVAEAQLPFSPAVNPIVREGDFRILNPQYS